MQLSVRIRRGTRLRGEQSQRGTTELGCLPTARQASGAPPPNRWLTERLSIPGGGSGLIGFATLEVALPFVVGLGFTEAPCMGIERRRLAGALLSGVLAGSFYGFFQGFTEGSVVVGVLSGLFFGLFMSVVFYVTNRAGEHLVGLTYRQKRAVLRAVRRGEPVSDPALAGPTIRHAQLIQASAGGQRLGIVLGRSLLVASLLGLVLALLLGSTAGALAASFSLVVWTVIVLVGPPLEQRKATRARAAEVAASHIGPSQ